MNKTGPILPGGTGTAAYIVLQPRGILRGSQSREDVDPNKAFQRVGFFLRLFLALDHVRSSVEMVCEVIRKMNWADSGWTSSSLLHRLANEKLLKCNF